VGAWLAGFLLSPLFSSATIKHNHFSLPALVVSLLGAIIVLVFVSLWRRGTVR